jgi:hypothetical protein
VERKKLNGRKQDEIYAEGVRIKAKRVCQE